MNTATPKAPEKKRDRALFARLIESYQADRVGIFVDFDRLNHPRSPVWNPWENIAPLLGILQSSASTEALLQGQLSDEQEKLDYIDNVEAASIITPARGSKVAPASKQFSLLIAIVLGLLVGILAAIISTAIRPVRPAIGTEPTT